MGCDMLNWHTRMAILQVDSFPNPWIPDILDILCPSRNLSRVFQSFVEPLLFANYSIIIYWDFGLYC